LKANGASKVSTFYLIVLGLELGVEMDIIIDTQLSLGMPIDAIRRMAVIDAVHKHSWSHWCGLLM
jgi:hypothetical protein